MTINKNMAYMMQEIMKSGNPEQAMLNMMQQMAPNNPFFSNLFSLAKGNNIKEIENIARNSLKEKGLDFDTEFNNFKRNLGVLK